MRSLWSPLPVSLSVMGNRHSQTAPRVVSAARDGSVPLMEGSWVILGVLGWRLLVGGGGLGGFVYVFAAVVSRWRGLGWFRVLLCCLRKWVRGTAEPCPRGPRHRFAVTSRVQREVPNLRLCRGAPHPPHRLCCFIITVGTRLAVSACVYLGAVVLCYHHTKKHRLFKTV